MPLVELEYYEFESLVSFEGCKTSPLFIERTVSFESLVSFEGCKTVRHVCLLQSRLRVL